MRGRAPVAGGNASACEHKDSRAFAVAFGKGAGVFLVLAQLGCSAVSPAMIDAGMGCPPLLGSCAKVALFDFVP